jgi:hypothetical protein
LIDPFMTNANLVLLFQPARNLFGTPILPQPPSGVSSGRCPGVSPREAIRLLPHLRTPRRYWLRASSIVSTSVPWPAALSKTAFQSWWCTVPSQPIAPGLSQKRWLKQPSRRGICLRIYDPIPVTNHQPLVYPQDQIRASVFACHK